MRKLFAADFVIPLLLTACAAPTAAPTLTILPTTVPTHTEVFSSATAVLNSTARPSNTPKPSSSPRPSHTPSVDETLIAKVIETQKAKIATFSYVCDPSLFLARLSPDEKWVANWCDTGANDGPTLEIVNQSGKHWVLHFKDYVLASLVEQLEGTLPPGNLWPAYWSDDGGFLYFTAHISGDGGWSDNPCSVYDDGSGESGQGLYRLDLRNGKVSTVLPVSPAVTFYKMAFSPTGRRLAYHDGGNPVILDIKTGEKLTLKIGEETARNFAWSPDGMQLAYATCTSQAGAVVSSAIKIFSIEQDDAQTLFSVENNLLTIVAWKQNTLEINQGESLLFFDTATGDRWAATPQP